MTPKRVIVTRFRDVPWEKIKKCHKEPGRGAGTKWRELRGQPVELETKRSKKPLSASCSGPFWNTTTQWRKKQRRYFGVTVCAHMIEAD